MDILRNITFWITQCCINTSHHNVITICSFHLLFRHCIYLNKSCAICVITFFHDWFHIHHVWVIQLWSINLAICHSTQNVCSLLYQTFLNINEIVIYMIITTSKTKCNVHTSLHIIISRNKHTLKQFHNSHECEWSVCIVLKTSVESFNLYHSTYNITQRLLWSPGIASPVVPAVLFKEQAIVVIAHKPSLLPSIFYPFTASTNLTVHLFTMQW